MSQGSINAYRDTYESSTNKTIIWAAEIKFMILCIIREFIDKILTLYKCQYKYTYSLNNYFLFEKKKEHGRQFQKIKSKIEGKRQWHIVSVSRAHSKGGSFAPVGTALLPIWKETGSSILSHYHFQQI